MEPYNPSKRLGAVIRARRTGLSMSQDALGKAVGVSFQQIQKYEKGSNHMSFPMLLAVAKALDTDIIGLAQDMQQEAAPVTNRSGRQEFELARRITRLAENARKGVIALVNHLAHDNS